MALRHPHCSSRVTAFPHYHDGRKDSMNAQVLWQASFWMHTESLMESVLDELSSILKELYELVGQPVPDRLRE